MSNIDGLNDHKEKESFRIEGEEEGDPDDEFDNIDNDFRVDLKTNDNKSKIEPHLAIFYVQDKEYQVIINNFRFLSVTLITFFL